MSATFSQIEIVNPHIDRGGHIRFALFDFDGTISLIREGWQEIMVSMMVEILQDTPTDEPHAELVGLVTDFVDRLTGRQTIYQMIRLEEEVSRRGGTALTSLEYKQIYNERLWARIEGRVDALNQGIIPPEDLVVPGVISLLEKLKLRNVTMFLASGTDLVYVKNEAESLGIAHYFEGRIFGALDQYEKFSKKMIIADILAAHKVNSRGLVTFGDGYVEIEETRAVKGVAVGVASEESTREGINEWKRHRLIEAGADIIVPDFRASDQLVQYLFEK